MVTRKLRQKISENGNTFSEPIDLGAAASNVTIILNNNNEIKDLQSYINYKESQITTISWEDI